MGLDGVRIRRSRRARGSSEIIAEAYRHATRVGFELILKRERVDSGRGALYLSCRECS